MNPSGPGWAAVVVNLDGGEMLFETLRSIDAQSARPAERVVVDNGSAEDERREIARRHPDWTIVALPKNHGFSYGSNRGIAATAAPWVALVNNDVILDPDWSARLIERIELDGGEPPPPRESVIPSPPQSRLPLAALQGAVLDRGGVLVDTLGITLDETVSAVPLGAGALAARIVTGSAFDICGPSATAAFYRREALEAAAGRGHVFPNAFFAYYEDVDLALRLWRLGWRSLCEPKAVARHRGSITGDRTPVRRRRLIARNRRWCLRRNVAPEALAKLDGPIGRGDRRSVTTALMDVGFSGARGALDGVRQGKESDPPEDPIAAAKLPIEEIEREMVRGGAARRPKR